MGSIILPLSRLVFTLLTLVAGCLLPAVGVRAEPASDVLSRDARLDQRVTIDPGLLYLGELLEELSRQTGIRLVVDDSQGAVSGIALTASVRGVPLRQVMHGLVELFTHRLDQWEWRATGAPSRYRLVHQRLPREAAAAVQAEVLRRWQADVRMYRGIGRLPDNERALRVRTRPDLFHPAGMDWDRATLLGELTDAELETLLRDGEVPVDPSRLSPRGRAAYERALASRPAHRVVVRSATGELVDAPPDPHPPIAFRVQREPDWISPVLYLRVGASMQSTIGGPDWDGHWVQQQGGGWLGHQEEEFQAALQQRNRVDPAAGREGPPATTLQHLRRVVREQELNLLADLIGRHRVRGMNPWVGKTPEQTIYPFAATVDCAVKRVGRLYLLRRVTGATHPRAYLVAWPRIKALRQAAARNHGYLDFRQLLTLAQMNREQLLGLAEEFPVAHPDHLENWRPLLQFYLHLDARAQEQVRRPAGLPLRDAGVVARAFLEEGPDRLGVRGVEVLKHHAREASVSLRLEPWSRGEERGWQLVWEIHVPGAAVRRRSWVQPPRQPLDKLHAIDGAAAKVLD